MGLWFFNYGIPDRSQVLHVFTLSGAENHRSKTNLNYNIILLRLRAFLASKYLIKCSQIHGMAGNPEFPNP